MEQTQQAAKKVWTEKDIDDLLQRIGADQLHRPLSRLWERQTAAEQDAHETHVYNQVGFNAYDAPFAGKLLEWHRAGKSYSEKQANALRKMLRKYRKQLANIANSN